MFFPRTNIRLGVRDTGRSVVFYEALLGAAPSQRSAKGAVFELDSPPLLLTVEERPARERGARLLAVRPSPRPDLAMGASPRHDAARRAAGRLAAQGAVGVAEELRVTSGFALLVDEPRGVGDAAIALRRAGIRLRLEDAGIEACDPDGNAWRVRFIGSLQGRSVVAGKAGDR